MSSPTNLIDPREYTAKWLEENQVKVNEAGNLVDSVGRETTDIFRTMYLDSQRDARIHNAAEREKKRELQKTVKAIKETDLRKALDEYRTKERLLHVIRLQQSLVFTGENDLVEQWVEAVTGRRDPKDIAVMKHWLWMVKRKVKDLPVNRHIMPILFGKQDGGKSQAVIKLTAPLKGYMLTIDLEAVTDPRNFKSFSRKYIAFTDEMGGADRADIKKFKKQVTAESNSARELFTEDSQDHKVRVSYIGAANEHVNELIVDSTGMRRFWQLNCLDQLNWDVINELDYLGLWQSIDESLPEGYIKPVLAEIRAVQNEMVVIDNFSAWVDDAGIKACQEGFEPKRVPIHDLYQNYVSWCEESGLKAFNKIWLGKKLANIGVVGSKIRIGTTTVNVREIAPESEYQRQDQQIESKISLVKDAP